MKTDCKVDAISIMVPVRYDEEDIPQNFPGRVGNTLKLVLDIESRKIRDWPASFGAYKIQAMKVCDEGVYEILDLSKGTVIARVAGYVPKLLPGRHCGDYIMLDILADGTVQGWNPTIAELDEFLDVAEQQQPLARLHQK